MKNISGLKTIGRWGISAFVGFCSVVLFPQATFADSSVPVVNSTGSTSNQTPNPKKPVIVDETLTDGVPMITSQAANPPQIISQAAVVMDLTTGTVVYAKNPTVSHYPASLTKILTALIALDKGNLNDELTVSTLATKQPPDKLYLVPGEKEPLGKLLYGMLLNSANDAAVVIAQNYGGSIQGFAKLMNEKAASLGANHTHFDNPSGLPDPKHVTTAYDLALITRAAMQNPTFAQIVATKHYNWTGQAWHRNLVNINPMLFTYPGAIGVKTGYTSVAHETLAVAARRGNQTFLAILMDAPLNREIDNDATTLLNYAFKHYESSTVINQGTEVGSYKLTNGKTVPVYTSRPVMESAQKGKPFSIQSHLEYRKNVTSTNGGRTTVGTLELTHNGTVVATEPVTATLPKAPAILPEVSHSRSIIWTVGGIGVVAFLAFLFRGFRRKWRRRRRWYGT